MPYKNPLEDIQKGKEEALGEYRSTSERVRRNKQAQLAAQKREIERKKKEHSKWGWLRGGAKGAGTGALTGAAIGSIIPGLGTGIGALIGGGLGALGGGALGSMGPEAENALSDVTGAARTIGGVANTYGSPKDRLLQQLDAQGRMAMQQNPSGSNYGADMGDTYTAPLPEEQFSFTQSPDIDPELLKRLQRTA